MSEDIHGGGGGGGSLSALDAPSLGLDEIDHFGELVKGLPASVRIMLDPRLFDQISRASSAMAKAENVIPKHLLGRPSACFVVLSSAIEWKLNWWFVARNTYMTPGGSIAFQGQLCHAILENSGRFISPIEFEHVGDWDAIAGMMTMKKGDSGKEYPAPTWRGLPEEKGLGVIVHGHVRGERVPRVWPAKGPFLLSQAYPLNSPLWATDPRTQICYLAVRRFGTLAVPGIYGGAQFSVDDFLEASDLARDVTPRPEQSDFKPARGKKAPAASAVEPAAAAAEPAKGNGAAAAAAPPAVTIFAFADEVGEAHEFPSRELALVEYAERLDAAADGKALEALWENGEALRAMVSDGPRRALEERYQELLQKFAPPAPAATSALAVFDVAVPMSTAMSAEAWYPQAMARLREMAAAKCPPADYARYREANADAITRLKRELLGWHRNLDKKITEGEQGTMQL